MTQKKRKVEYLDLLNESFRKVHDEAVTFLDVKNNREKYAPYIDYSISQIADHDGCHFNPYTPENLAFAKSLGYSKEEIRYLCQMSGMAICALSIKDLIAKELSEEVQELIYCLTLQMSEVFGLEAQKSIYNHHGRLIQSPQNAAKRRWQGKEKKYRMALDLIKTSIHQGKHPDWWHNDFVNWVLEQYKDEYDRNPFKTIKNEEGKITLQGLSKPELLKRTSKMFDDMNIAHRVRGKKVQKET